MAKRYDKAFKEDVLGKVRSGGKVREVAPTFDLIHAPEIREVLSSSRWTDAQFR
jgi:transposase-like protein